MEAIPTLLSIDRYQHTNYKPDVDFVDGTIQERNMGEYEHNKIQTLIAVLFTLNAKPWRTDAVVDSASA